MLFRSRGEVAGRCGVSYSAIMATRPDWLPSGKVLAPVLIGTRRTKTFPNVPAVTEFAKDEATRQTLEVLLAYEYMDRPLLVPPGTPPARLAILRKAFHDAMNDPAFLAEAARQNLELDEIAGERLEKVLNETFALPKDRIDAAKAALSVGK